MIADAGRRRVALWLVAAAVVAPAVVGLLVSLLGGIGFPSAVVATALPGVLLGLAAAAVAPVTAAPRVAVAVVGVGQLAAGAMFGTTASVAGTAVAGIVLSVVGLFGVPALAWLGSALGGDLHERLARAWRTATVVAVVLAVISLAMNVVTTLTFGALLRGTTGVRVGLGVQQAVGGMATVAALYVAVCAVRSVRALDGVPPDPLRPRFLAGALVAGALWGLAGAMATMQGL